MGAASTPAYGRRVWLIEALSCAPPTRPVADQNLLPVAVRPVVLPSSTFTPPLMVKPPLDSPGTPMIRAEVVPPVRLSAWSEKPITSNCSLTPATPAVFWFHCCAPVPVRPVDRP